MMWYQKTLAAAVALWVAAVALDPAPAMGQSAGPLGEAVFCTEPAPLLEFDFSAEQRFATGSMPIDIAPAQMDAAGPPDLVTADGGDATLSALLNDGTGAFAQPATSATDAMPAALAVADLNGDGLPDAATANRNAGSVSLLVNNGDGSLGMAGTVSGLAVMPEAIAAADLDNDGDVDLAVTGPSVPSASLPAPGQVGTGDNAPLGLPVTFSPDPVNFGAVVVGETVLRVVTMTAEVPGSIDVVQPFASPDPDFSVPVDNCVGMVLPSGASCDFTVAWTPSSAGTDASTVSTVLPVIGMNVSVDVIGQGVQAKFNVVTLDNQGNGQFAVKQNFGTVSQPSAISAADYDGNGLADLAIADAGANNVFVFTNQADGFAGDRFQTVALSGSTPSALAPADFNCDGNVDLGATNLDSDNVSILINTDEGVLGETQLLDAVANPAALTAGDFDGDGVPDLVASTFGEAIEGGDDIGDAATVLRNDGAGMFSVDTAFGVGGGPAGIAAGDFNGDGFTDLATANSVSDDVSVILSEVRATELSIAGMQLPGSIGGDNLFTQFDIANTGDFAAAQLVFMSELPPDLTLVAGYNRAPSCSLGAPDDNQREVRCDAATIPDWQCGVDGQLLLCQLEFLPPGGQAPLVVHGSTAGGSFTLDAEVVAGNSDPSAATIEVER